MRVGEAVETLMIQFEKSSAFVFFCLFFPDFTSSRNFKTGFRGDVNVTTTFANVQPKTAMRWRRILESNKISFFQRREER